MQVTAIIQNDTLIIPNLDLSYLKSLADKNGLVQLDLPILDNSLKQANKNTPNPSKGLATIIDDVNDKTRDKLSANELLQAVTINTDKVATIEEMNQSIAKVYENWKDQ